MLALEHGADIVYSEELIDRRCQLSSALLR